MAGSPRGARRRRRPFPAVALGAVVLLAAALVPGVAQAVPPPNDDFAGRTVVAEADLPFTDNQSTVDATKQAGEPPPSCGFRVGKTVWYEFTPTATTALRADTFGSDFDTVLGVWTGPGLGSLTEVACNDDAGSLQSKLVFLAEGGTTYFIQAGGFNRGSGDLTFHLRIPSAVGFVSGTVTEEGTGTPLPDLCVEVVDDDLGTFAGFAETDADGDYRVAVRSGSYTVAFHDFCDRAANHLSEWYDDQGDPASADPVVVAAPAVTGGIDAALAPGCAGFGGRLATLNQVAGGPGPDALTGTPGDDLICSFGGGDTINGRGGDDWIFSEGGPDDVDGGGGADRIFAGGGADAAGGGGGADRLFGGGGGDTLRGQRGRDVLRGEFGPDVLDGGPGQDRCNGGPGVDVGRSCESSTRIP